MARVQIFINIYSMICHCSVPISILRLRVSTTILTPTSVIRTPCNPSHSITIYTMKHFINAVAFLASTGFSIDVIFDSGPGCTGQALYGRNDLPNVQCHNMSTISILQPAQSINIVNVASGETIKVYSDTECLDEIYTTSVSSCFNEPNGYVGSFQIQAVPAETTSEWMKSTKEVVPFGIKLSNYTGLATAGAN